MKKDIKGVVNEVEDEDLQVGLVGFIFGFFKFIYQRIIKPG